METGRNDPCPCGSGKKYKKCCLQKDVAAQPRKLVDFAYETHLALRKRVTDKLDRLILESLSKEAAQEFLEELWSVPDLGVEEADAARAHDGIRKGFEDQVPLAFRHAFLFDGGGAADFFLDARPERFTEAERRFLEDYAEAPMTYVQFREFFPEEGYCRVEDIFDGTPYTVFDKNLARMGTPHVIAAARLVPFRERDGDAFELITTAFASPSDKEFILEYLADEAGILAQEVFDKPVGSPITPEDIHELLDTEPIVFYWLDLMLRYASVFQTKPILRTTDGGDWVFLSARFACPEPRRLRIALDSQKGFMKEEEDGEHVYRWLNDDEVLLGTLRFLEGGATLSVETNSRERLGEWEKMLLALGEATLLEVKEQDIGETGEDEDQDPGDLLSEEELRELMPELEGKFAEKWLKEKIPALDGLTPVEAAKTHEGRKLLKELFDYMEHQEAMFSKGGFRGGFDLDAMKRQLGMPED